MRPPVLTHNLENADVKSMEYNSPGYIHPICRAMNLARTAVAQ